MKKAFKFDPQLRVNEHLLTKYPNLSEYLQNLAWTDLALEDLARYVNRKKLAEIFIHECSDLDFTALCRNKRFHALSCMIFNLENTKIHLYIKEFIDIIWEENKSMFENLFLLQRENYLSILSQKVPKD